jgi:hypothetical protein
VGMIMGFHCGIGGLALSCQKLVGRSSISRRVDEGYTYATIADDHFILPS